MSTFGKNILNRLLDKYENSVLSKKGSQKNIKISLGLNDKELETYVCRDSYNYRDRNDAILSQYSQWGFIKIEKDRYDYFKSLELNVENVNEVYKFLKRSNPADDLNKVCQILNAESKDGIIGNFVSFCNEWIMKKYAMPKAYFDSSNQLNEILLGLKEIQKLDKETKFRDFSVKTFGDSKKFEKLKTKIAKILYEFDDTCGIDDFSEETVCEILCEKNLVKNTTYAIMKGNVCFEINNVVINLMQLGYEICLSDKMINDLKFISIGSKKVITVENLTTFYTFDKEDCIVVYLGGFHNQTKRMLLKKLYNSNQNLFFSHFGDIDAGGINILKHLRSKTGIAFAPYKMDIDTLIENRKSWKKLTANDIKRLKNIKDAEFVKLTEYMLTNNCKLEQEAIE